MLHLVSPGDLCRWDAGGRWIALNARHWITGPTTWGKCLGRGNGSAERLARTGATLELVPAAEQKNEAVWRVAVPPPATHLHFNNIHACISYVTLCIISLSAFLKWNLIHLWSECLSQLPFRAAASPISLLAVSFEAVSYKNLLMQISQCWFSKCSMTVLCYTVTI